MSGERYYSARELAGLPGMPNTKAGVIHRASKEDFPSRPRQGKGGGVEYPESCLPKETRAHLIVRSMDKALDKAAEEVPEFIKQAVAEAQASVELSDHQRQARDAREGVLAALKKLRAETGMSQEAALQAMVGSARLGKLDAKLIAMLKVARDGRGRKTPGADDLPSIRTLKRWLSQADLAPKGPVKDFSIPAWSPVFLRHYQQPQKPSVEQAYAEFCKDWRTDRPSIWQVRRFLAKLGNVAVEKGRRGPRDLKNIRPFVRRTFEELLPNDIWTADGHQFDAEVQHPITGKPFRPEITAIVDIATRRTVGFSVGLAESALAVVDAVRFAVETNGIAAVFYVDNGSGYDNQMMSGPGIGLMGRCGIEMTHSLPYNSQSRGVIERRHHIFIKAAKQLPSYIGKDMDAEAKQKFHKLSRDGKDGVIVLPIAWREFIARCEDAIAEYNDKPNRALPVITSAEGKRRHQTPNERLAQFKAQGWEPHGLDANELDPLFRPRLERTVLRGEIALFKNRYFSRDLEEWHGELVQVGYDIHDPQWVWVHDGDGRLITRAELDGNATPYMPMSYVERAREKRADARQKRLETKLDAVEAERKGRPALEVSESIMVPGMTITRDMMQEGIGVRPAEPAMAKDEEEETPQDRWEKYQRLTAFIAEGGVPIGKDETFMRTYPQSKEFSAWMRRQVESAEEN